MNRHKGLGVLVTVLFVLGVLDLVDTFYLDPLSAMVFSVVRVTPLLFYRRWPVATWVTVLCAVVATSLVASSGNVPWPWGMTNVLVVTTVAGLVASLGRRRLSLTMLGVLTTGYVVLTALPGGGLSSVAGVAVLIPSGLAMVVGDVVHGRQRMAAELAEERQVSASERELRAVVEERGRIARELHDVVAHHMSMITVQAETARFRHQGLPSTAVAEFTEIAGVARVSLSELRGLLSALRDDGADPSRTPQPTLADLPALVDRITAAGTPVTLTAATNTTDLPQVAQLAVYRVVQEGLSNVVRHAGNARTWVTIIRVDTELEVEVMNEQSRAFPATESQGHGLVGLRERVTLLGGTFEVDQPDGGWRIRAVLPL